MPCHTRTTSGARYRLEAAGSASKALTRTEEPTARLELACGARNSHLRQYTRPVPVWNLPEAQSRQRWAPTEGGSGRCTRCMRSRRAPWYIGLQAILQMCCPACLELTKGAGITRRGVARHTLELAGRARSHRRSLVGVTPSWPTAGGAASCSPRAQVVSGVHTRSWKGPLVSTPIHDSVAFVCALHSRSWCRPAALVSPLGCAARTVCARHCRSECAPGAAVSHSRAEHTVWSWHGDPRWRSAAISLLLVRAMRDAAADAIEVAVGACTSYCEPCMHTVTALQPDVTVFACHSWPSWHLRHCALPTFCAK